MDSGAPLPVPAPSPEDVSGALPLVSRDALPPYHHLRPLAPPDEAALLRRHRAFLLKARCTSSWVPSQQRTRALLARFPELSVAWAVLRKFLSRDVTAYIIWQTDLARHFFHCETHALCLERMMTKLPTLHLYDKFARCFQQLLLVTVMLRLENEDATLWPGCITTGQLWLRVRQQRPSLASSIQSWGPESKLQCRGRPWLRLR